VFTIKRLISLSSLEMSRRSSDCHAGVTIQKARAAVAQGIVSADQAQRMAETMLNCLRSRILRNCSRPSQARAVRLVVNWTTAVSYDLPNPPVRGAVKLRQDYQIFAEGRMKAFQGRLVEPETDVRRALLSRLPRICP
jgi:hypothetical protein